MNLQLRNWVESHLWCYKEQGAMYVVVYRHRLNDDLMFVEPYKDWYTYNAARRYWQKDGYVVKRMYDLDYADYIKEQNAKDR